MLTMLFYPKPISTRTGKTWVGKGRGREAFACYRTTKNGGEIRKPAARTRWGEIEFREAALDSRGGRN